MNELKTEIKNLIITSLNLEDISADDIEDKSPLFSDDGLGLDSVDALELGLAVQKKYGLILDAKTHNLKEIFESVHSLADYIYKARSENE